MATSSSSAAGILSQLLRPTQISATTKDVSPWLWHGYLAPAKVTLLSSQWKSGKITLVSVLLARLANGGQLAGLPVAAA
jgi:hypothetical protein